ncbi:MAG: recombination protein RecR [Rickettsiales bacterium]|nr:recombination protein RecR [Actinomycetota bacterium]MBA94692.1 recombination protein RecR [Rickettsiales bacterium]MBE33332.1 recombination protein RecR [bacterium]
MNVNPLEPLISELKRLPGVGDKSAQRLAFFLLSISEKDVQQIATTMVETRKKIVYCQSCFNISLDDTCYICADERRLQNTLCIVSEPKDIFAMERTGVYKGLYHVLGGLISPLDGVHPESLRIKELVERLQHQSFDEVVFAINPTVEGDSTIMYLSAILESLNLTITKLAYGLPMGSDIDYADEMTLAKAISSRSLITK